MKTKQKEVKCEKCEKEASFFHSRCCNAHFEGAIRDGKFMIVCERCGKFVAYINK